MKKTITPALAAAAVALSLGACTGETTQSEATATGEHYPVTIENCGKAVTFNEIPTRVVLLESASVTGLEGIGVLDRVVARAGSFPPGYYDADLAQRIEAIPALSEDVDASGHLMMSQEVIVAEEPDLVMGLPEGISREGLSDVGANILIQNVFCDDHPAQASFEAVYDQLRDYGKVFDRETEAAALVDSLTARVEAASAKAANNAPRRAAVLYPSIGGGPLYAYGSASMADPQLRAAGFENVFADVPERVFEVGSEDLIARDPEVLILLHQGDADAITSEVLNLPGAQSIAAIKNQAVMTQLFNFTEPATPLTVEGLEQIVDHFYPREKDHA